MKFNISGYGINDIVRTLHVKKIKIYNVKYISNSNLEFEVEDKYEKKVKRQIQNVKHSQTLTKFKKCRKFIIANVGLLLGVFFGAVISCFLSNYIWQIKIFGTKELTTGEIKEVLAKNGIKEGKINNFNSEQIENVLLNNYGRIAQVSVVKEGTSIIINLSEKLIYEEQTYEPIKAKYNGIITNINLITGTNNVRVGDYVNTGDILVFPYNINANGEKIAVKPIAEIEAEMYITSVCELNRTDTILKRTGRKKNTYIYKLFNKKIFTKNKNSFALFETRVYNENVSGLVPFTRDVVVYYELCEHEVVNNFEDGKEGLITQSKDLAYKQLPIYKQIVNENTKTSQTESKLIAVTTLTVLGIIND